MPIIKREGGNLAVWERVSSAVVEERAASSTRCSSTHFPLPLLPRTPTTFIGLPPNPLCSTADAQQQHEQKGPNGKGMREGRLGLVHVTECRGLTEYSGESAYKRRRVETRRTHSNAASR